MYYFPENATTIDALVRKFYPGSEHPDASPELRRKADNFRQGMSHAARSLAAKADAPDPLENVLGANFDFYAKLSYWTLDEAVALSFGKAHDALSWDRVRFLTRSSAIAAGIQRRRVI